MPSPFTPTAGGRSSRILVRPVSWLWRPSVPELPEAVPPVPVEAPVPVEPPLVPDVPPVPPCSNVRVSSLYWPSWTIALLRPDGYSGYRSAICFGPRRLVSRARSVSSFMLPRRSQAIAFSQETESTGVQFCGL